MSDGVEAETFKLLTMMVRALVKRPLDVSIVRMQKGDKVVFRIHVNPSDVGNVIGRQGSTARAIRMIVAAAGARHTQKFGVDIADPGDPSKAQGRPSSQLDGEDSF